MFHPLSRGLLVHDGWNAQVRWARDHGTFFVTTSLPLWRRLTEPLKVVLKSRGLPSEARGIFKFGLLESLASTYDHDLLRGHGLLVFVESSDRIAFVWVCRRSISWHLTLTNEVIIGMTELGIDLQHNIISVHADA